MRSCLLKSILLFLILIGIAWSIYYFVPWGKVLNVTGLVSVETEEQLGEQIIEGSIQNNPAITLNKNATLDSAVQIIANRLLKKIKFSPYSYHFGIINDKQENAFTLPGGNIFIYSGLIRFCETPEELAAVMAHEIGHAESRHVVTKIIKEIGISLVFGYIFGVDASMLTELFRTMASTAFDREQEREADNFGFELMEQCGIHPQSLASFFSRLEAKMKSNESLELLQTHPSNESRISAAKNYKVKPGFQPLPFSLNWKRVQLNVAE